MTPLTPFKRSPAVGAPYYIRFSCKNRAYLWSCKTADLALARKRGADYRRKVIAEEFGLIDGMKAGVQGATFHDLFTSYLQLVSPPEPTRRQNVAAFKRILATLGVPVTAPLTAIDPQFIARYQKAALESPAMVGRQPVSVNSEVRKARSLLSRRSLVSMATPIPPAVVTNLFHVPLLREAEPRRELPSPEAYDAAMAHLVAFPAHLRAFALAASAGCRSCEVLAAKRSWIDGNLLYIGGKPDFTAKSQRWRVVALDPAVTALLLASDAPEYLVGANRHRIVTRELPAMLQRLGFPGHPLHALRRRYGSIIYSTQSPALAKAALGHQSMAVGEKHYFRTEEVAAAIPLK